jgi:antitoxin Phd
MKIERILFKSLADAKAKFSKVVEDVKENDVVITKNGVPAAVIMDYSRYVKLMKFIDEVRDVYLLDLGDPSLKGIEIDFDESEEV